MTFTDPTRAPSPLDLTDLEAIQAAINTEELVTLALELGNIPSPSKHEAAAGQYVYDWMTREGFNPRKAGVSPERFNVIGEYGGNAPLKGRNLLLTAHLDTESPLEDAALNAHKYRADTLADPEWRNCWIEDGKIFGYPVSNDRGPMSCFLIAAKALKTAGFDLAGKVYLTACPGEIGPEPVEEYAGVDYLGKDIGANYLLHHGGVAPDYAIAAEGCDFGATWQGCGYALFRIRIYGRTVFTPLITHPASAKDHPNPLYRIGEVTDALLEWGRAYEAASIYAGPGGVSAPKVQLSAIRGGVPFDFGAGTEICSLYFEAGLNPHQSAAEAQRGIESVLAPLGLEDFDVEAVILRHGSEANAEAVAPLAGAVDAATRLVLGNPLEVAHPAYSSMWRDHNVFNLNRIPALTTGMPRFRPTPQDMTHSALIYALTMLSVCGRV
ncbi:MAG: peptidase M20 [Asticcacaulis sp.]